MMVVYVIALFYFSHFCGDHLQKLLKILPSTCIIRIFMKHVLHLTNAIFARIIFFPANGMTCLLCCSDGYNSHQWWWWGGWRCKSPGTGDGRWAICWNTAGRRTLHGRWCQIPEIHLCGVSKLLSSLTQARFDLEVARNQIRDFYIQQLQQTLREVRQPVYIHLPINEPDLAAM